MPHYYVTQPNGKIGLYSTIIDEFLYEDMNEEEFYELWKERNGTNDSLEEATSYIDRFETFEGIKDCFDNINQLERFEE